MLNNLHKMHFLLLNTSTTQFVQFFSRLACLFRNVTLNPLRMYLLCSALLFSTHLLSANTLPSSDQLSEFFTETKIAQIIKSIGKPYRSIVNNSLQLTSQHMQIAETRYNFQDDPFAPFSLTFTQHELVIEWLQPKAQTKKQYSLNSENQILARNLMHFLFGDDRLLRDLNQNLTTQINLRSISGYDVTAIRNGIQYRIILNPVN